MLAGVMEGVTTQGTASKAMKLAECIQHSRSAAGGEISPTHPTKYRQVDVRRPMPPTVMCDF